MLAAESSNKELFIKNDGKALSFPYDWKLATHVICDDFSSPNVQEGSKRSLRLAKTNWIRDCVDKNTLLNYSFYSCNPYLLFKGICASSCQIDSYQSSLIDDALETFGGRFSKGLMKSMTHLFTYSGMGAKCKKVLDKPSLSIKLIHPQWLLDCLQFGQLIDQDPYLFPNPSYKKNDSSISKAEPTSLFRNVLHGKRIYFSNDLNLPTNFRHSLQKFSVGIGAKIAESINDCDIFIGLKRDTIEFNLASNKNTTIGTISWLLNLFVLGSWKSPLLNALHYPFPSVGFLKDQMVAVTNYTDAARIYLEKLLLACGATYTKDLKPTNTLLIAASSYGQKYGAAKVWNIPTVHHSWLYSSFKNLSSQAFTDFPVPLDDSYMDFIFPCPLNVEKGSFEDTLKSSLTKGNSEVLLDDLSDPSVSSIKGNKTNEELEKEFKSTSDNFGKHIILTSSFSNQSADKGSSLAAEDDRNDEGSTITGVNRELQDEGRLEIDAKSSKTNTPPSPLLVGTPSKESLKEASSDDELPVLATKLVDNVIKEKSPLSLTPKVVVPSHKETYTDEKKLIDELDRVNPLNSSQLLRSKRKSAATALSMLQNVIMPDVLAFEREKKRRQTHRSVSSGEVSRESSESRNTNAKASKRVYITFTGYDKKPSIDNLKKLDMSITSNPSKCTHLIAPRILRTSKFLCSIPYGPCVVTMDWINSCLKTHEIVDEEPYLLNDPEKELELGCTLESALKRARAQGPSLLEDYVVYLTSKTVAPENVPAVISIVKSNGGVCSTLNVYNKRLARHLEDGNVVLITCNEDSHIWTNFLDNASQNKTIFLQNYDWLIKTVLRQEIDVNDRIADEFARAV
ncbi:BRCT domain protein Brc1 [Schizosaccharomyces pombe]|uniref:BRCT-containing protein 1 n=2 Tax=Schizosaccharomyces pombe TaxID=4896 RepID=BRC1_SCHPO